MNKDEERIANRAAEILDERLKEVMNLQKHSLELEKDWTNTIQTGFMNKVDKLQERCDELEKQVSVLEMCWKRGGM